LIVFFFPLPQDRFRLLRTSTAPDRHQGGIGTFNGMVRLEGFV
jgi:hypothetical protein